MGGVLQIPGFPTMATTALDPVSSINSGGIRTFNNTSGTKTTAYQVFNSSVKGTFAKANGLGALVALCQSAPVEIGNRVWLDKNGNGIQDADEPGIAGVMLTLYGSNGKFVSSTKTDANGYYYFTINPRQSYLIKLDHLYDYTHGQLLALQLTQADQDTTNHTADSKAVLPHPSNPIDKDNFPQIVIDPHEPGQNDDVQGIGFKAFTPPPHTVAGLVYNDYNQNGSHGAREPGVNGVIVSAYDDIGDQVATSTTGSVRGIQGWYELHLSPSVNAVRVQFQNFGASSIHPQLVGFEPGNHQGGTTVTFVNNTANGAIANLGIERPGEFCQNNPQLASNCYVFGNQSKAQDHVVVRFPYDSAGNTPPPTPIANAPDVGTTWGLAYRRATDTLYVASYMKRHAGFRPGGSTGAIYEIQGATTPNPQPVNAPFVDLNQVFGKNTAGSNPHNLSNYDLDAKAYDAVGKVSLGGIAMSEDDNTLYAVNLADRKLYGIPLGAVPALSHSSQHTHILHSTSTPAISRVAIPRPGDCVDKDFRPFSVTAYNNDIYVGAICSAESTITKKKPNGDINKIHAYVLLYTPGQKFAAKPAFEFGLNYARGCANGVSSPNCKQFFAATWHPWHPTFSWNAPNAYPVFPEPMLTSVTFDNGDLILGLRDRYGDQVGWNNPSPSGGARLSAITAGDLLRACLRSPGDITSGWNLENNGSCGDLTTNGKDDGQGPGVGEYYYQDNFLPFHDEVSLGGAYQVPGFSTVMTTNFNPTDRIDSGGTRAYDNTDGTKQWGYLVYSHNTPNTFGKADGLGTVIPMCQSAPIEIGNRVWLDSNSNGIQDAGEPGIAGLTVNLYAADGTTLVQSTTTDANGEYYFTIAPRTSYIIKMDNAADYTTGPLAGHTLTTPDEDLRTFDIDSKAHLSNPASPIGSGNYPQISVAAHTPGQNDHTLDIGFTGPPIPSIQHTSHHSQLPNKAPGVHSHPAAIYDNRRWKHHL